MTVHRSNLAAFLPQGFNILPKKLEIRSIEANMHGNLLPLDSNTAKGLLDEVKNTWNDHQSRTGETKEQNEDGRMESAKDRKNSRLKEMVAALKRVFLDYLKVNRRWHYMEPEVDKT